MITTAVIVVLALCAVVAWLAAKHTTDRDARRGLRGVGAGLATVAVILTAFATTVIVGAAEVGVPISFGRAGDPLRSGFHVKAPWTKVESFPVRPFGVPDVEIVARTSQAGQVTTVVGARWHVDPTRARDTYLQVRTGDEERITREVVDKAIGQSVGNVFVTKDNLSATTDRLGVEKALMAEMNRLVSPFGLIVDNVFVRAVEPDGKTADALARVAAQQRETEIAVESQATARAQAEARLVEATGLKAAAGQIPALTAEQVQALCLQTWERMAAKAITAGVALYTSPCGAGTPLVASQK